MIGAIVGDAVYKGYSPATVGLVVKIETKAFNFDAYIGQKSVGTKVAKVLTIRKANGETWEAPEGYVENYRNLIEQHRRKLATHEAALIKLLNAS